MKKQKKDLFLEYLLCCSAEDRAAVESFFAQNADHFRQGRRQNTRFRRDFENAVLAYASRGVSVQEALHRLDPTRTRGFYARDGGDWYQLDSAAKVYPLSMERGKMAVFRLSAYLKDPIVPELLQMALTFTVCRFPGFATTLKSGLFWHYLDSWKGHYAVTQETARPCRDMKIGRTGAVPLRVLWYENRISVEFFHILTDGTGGMVFLKTLSAEYLRLLGTPCAPADGVLDLNQVPCSEETANEFPRVAKKLPAAGFSDEKALQLGGSLSRVNPCRVLRFCMDAEALYAAAKGRNATVTAYLLSRILCACRSAMDKTSGDISVQVPVNMRKFYPSATLKNFSMYCGVRFPANTISQPDALLPGIAEQLKQKASADAMDKMVASTQNLVSMARYLPLCIKFPVVRTVYGFLGDRLFTTTLSNLGKVTFPPELQDEIRSLEFVLGTARTNRALCSLVTYGATASLSIAKQTQDPTFEQTLLRLLQQDGLDVTVEGSPIYEH